MPFAPERLARLIQGVAARRLQVPKIASPSAIRSRRERARRRHSAIRAALQAPHQTHTSEIRLRTERPNRCATPGNVESATSVRASARRRCSPCDGVPRRAALILPPVSRPPTASRKGGIQTAPIPPHDKALALFCAAQCNIACGATKPYQQRNNGVTNRLGLALRPAGPVQ